MVRHKPKHDQLTMFKFWGLIIIHSFCGLEPSAKFCPQNEWNSLLPAKSMTYRMAGNFGGEFILADWRF